MAALMELGFFPRWSGSPVTSTLILREEPEDVDPSYGFVHSDQERENRHGLSSDLRQDVAMEPGDVQMFDEEAD